MLAKVNIESAAVTIRRRHKEKLEKQSGISNPQVPPIFSRFPPFFSPFKAAMEISCAGEGGEGEDCRYAFTWEKEALM